MKNRCSGCRVIGDTAVEMSVGWASVAAKLGDDLAKAKELIRKMKKAMESHAHDILTAQGIYDCADFHAKYPIEHTPECPYGKLITEAEEAMK